MKLAPLALVFTLAACTERVEVAVNCETTGAPAVECTVKQTKGKGEVEVCWDFTATCENGTVVKPPRTCAKVKDGGEAKATIPADKLPNVDKCAGTKAPTALVDNLTINGKKPE